MLEAILLAISCWVGLSIILGPLVGRGFRVLAPSVPDPIPARVSAARAHAERTRAARMPVRQLERRGHTEVT